MMMSSGGRREVGVGRSGGRQREVGDDKFSRLIR